MVQWIVDSDSGPVVYGDGNVLPPDHLLRRDGVNSPIPERLTKIKTCLLPLLYLLFVVKSRVESSNSLSMLLQSLLIK